MIIITTIMGIIGALIGIVSGYLYYTYIKKKMIKKATILNNTKELFKNHTLESEGIDLPKREEEIPKEDFKSSPDSSPQINNEEVINK